MKTALAGLCLVAVALVASPVALGQTVTGQLQGHRTTGRTTQCVYNTVDGRYIKTISSVQLCPMSIQIRQGTITSRPSRGLDFSLANGSNPKSIMESVQEGRERMRRRKMYKLRMKLLRQRLQREKQEQLQRENQAPRRDSRFRANFVKRYRKSSKAYCVYESSDGKRYTRQTSMWSRCPRSITVN